MALLTEDQHRGALEVMLELVRDYKDSEISMESRELVQNTVETAERVGYLDLAREYRIKLGNEGLVF